MPTMTWSSSWNHQSSCASQSLEETWSSEFSFGGDINSRDSKELLDSCSFGEDVANPRCIRSSFCKPHHDVRKALSSEEFTVDKLRYGALGVYGRDTEIAILNQALESTVVGQKRGKHNSANAGQSQMVLISGYQGTGKTKLAFTLQENAKAMGGLFCYGKFDNQRNEPYYGITSACRCMCTELLKLKESKSTKRRFESLQSKMFETLKDELPLLSDLIPELKDVLNKDDVDNSHTTEDPNQNLEFAKNRMNFALVRFVGMVSRCFRPLVLVIDDLQWGDDCSLNLMELLLKDAGNCNLMIVGCYRSNELQSGSYLQSKLSALKEQESSEDFQTTNLIVRNLDGASSHQIVMALLGTDDSSTEELAAVAQQKSAGNAFFLVSFLTLLYEEKLLQFNLGTLRWRWDIAQVKDSTRATDNVVDLMKRKLDALPAAQRKLLTYCSFLGPSFSRAVLSLIWRWDNDNASHDVGQLLDCSVKEDGILEINDGRYRFVHDKVRECIQTVGESKEVEAMRLHVGAVLESIIDEDGFEDIFFVALNLLNSSSEHCQGEDERRKRLAELNLKAARRVTELSGFEIAATYVAKGLKVLPVKDRWEKFYTLTLHLLTIGAETCAVIGNMDTLTVYCEEIEQNARTMDDKLRMYFVRMDCFTRQTRFDDAMQLGLDVLKQYNYHFPKSSSRRVLSSILGLARRKNKANILAAKSVESMTVVEDQRTLGTMRILYKLCRCAYLSKSPLLPLVALRILEECDKHGVTQYSAPSHALMAIMLTGLAKDLDAGSKHAEHALQLVHRLGNKRMIAGVYVMTYGLVQPWTKPLRSMLRPLVVGYENGLQVGDAENAMWSIIFYLNLSFHAGRPLGSLDSDARMYSRQIQEFKRDECFPFLSIPWQAWRNFMSKDTDDPLLLSGDIVDEQKMLAMTNESSIDVVRSLISTNKQVLAAIFGEHERGSALAMSRADDLESQFAGSVMVFTDPFYRSLSLYAMARKTKSRRFLKEANRQRKIISGFAKKGNVNLLHLEAMLDAEAAAHKKDYQNAKKHWESAIRMSRGFLHHTALAFERYGEFLLIEMKDPSEAAFRFGQAYQSYKEWGSSAKVDQLMSKYGDMISCARGDALSSSIPFAVTASSLH